eukprot:5923870-Amphidinium_carterae.2
MARAQYLCTNNAHSVVTDMLHNATMLCGSSDNCTKMRCTMNELLSLDNGLMGHNFASFSDSGSKVCV